MTPRTFSASTTFVIAKEVLATELGSEFVILNLADGIYYGLDDAGAEIWKLLTRPVTVEEICRGISASFDVELDQCRTDVLKLLDSLASRSLIDVRGHD
jgi:Coenzyme PQQ synthesis protein D (PqqD)